MAARLVLLVTSPRVAPGALSWDAWQAVRTGVVLTREQDHPQREPLAAAGVVTEAVDPSSAPAAIARIMLDAARGAGSAVWLAGAGGDPDVAEALAQQAARSASQGEDVEVEIMPGSRDLPGARLLDVVATMDRLRSPGGCPWDAQQTHDSLAPYLLEEAYEAFEAIEDGDTAALREELGDVLLQVAFHARLAQERSDGTGWSIDDVAAGLVDKLVRRHPHVFAGRTVAGADEVVANWDAIKTAERGRASAVVGVPMSAPALTLAATLQRKAAKAGLPADLVTPELAAAETPAAALAALAAGWEAEPSVDSAAALLWALVDVMRHHDLDAEAALRGRARAFRDRLATAETTRPTGVEPVGRDEWRERWWAADPEV